MDPIVHPTTISNELGKRTTSLLLGLHPRCGTHSHLKILSWDVFLHIVNFTLAAHQNKRRKTTTYTITLYQKRQWDIHARSNEIVFTTPNGHISFTMGYIDWLIECRIHVCHPENNGYTRFEITNNGTSLAICVSDFTTTGKYRDSYPKNNSRNGFIIQSHPGAYYVNSKIYKKELLLHAYSCSVALLVSREFRNSTPHTLHERWKNVTFTEILKDYVQTYAYFVNSNYSRHPLQPLFTSIIGTIKELVDKPHVATTLCTTYIT